MVVDLKLRRRRAKRKKDQIEKMRQLGRMWTIDMGKYVSFFIKSQQECFENRKTNSIGNLGFY